MLLIYCVDNKLGGVTSLNYNLAANCPDQETEQWVIHIDQEEWRVARANISFPVDKEIQFHFTGRDHSLHNLKRLHALIPDREGALVLNYANEMAMLDHFPVRLTTYQLVHDMYNVRIARQYGHVVDVFICHNTHILEELRKLFPERIKDIFYLPHGVPVPEKYQQHDDLSGALRLLFLGRMTEAKGIFDLPLISRYLLEAGVLFEWTCIGNGPDLDQLKKDWPADVSVRFLSPASNKEVMDVVAEQQVFVLPTRFEGSPVSLIETMSAGLVPVITALPGGITDIVKNVIGYALPEGNTRAFADAIIDLYHDRTKLAVMGSNCREKIKADFDVRKTSAAYHQLFREFRTLYKTKKLKKMRLGSRLDHPLVPAFITRALRRK